MKIAIITGASSGLGQSFAREAVRQYPDIGALWLIARRKERLDAFAKTLNMPCVVLPLDLARTEGVRALIDALAREKPDIHLLVNNAGYGRLGPVAEGDALDLRDMVSLNCGALTALTAAALRYMPRGAHIVQVCSIASFLPTPNMAVYSATKAYVHAFTRALREELRPRGIHVTALCPGPMRTEFLDTAGVTGHSRLFEALPLVSPEKAAAGALRSVRRGRTIYTPRAVYKAYRVLCKVLPHALAVRLAKL